MSFKFNIFEMTEFDHIRYNAGKSVFFSEKELTPPSSRRKCLRSFSRVTASKKKCSSVMNNLSLLLSRQKVIISV